ncbi:MAG: hypothetical protein E7166_05050 [Firmicutes bacterium]|nr:hypothetical protein [Bacillota bacterium]
MGRGGGLVGYQDITIKPIAITAMKMKEDNNKYTCPVLYYTNKASNTGTYTIEVSVNKDNLNKKLKIQQLKLYDSDVKNIETPVITSINECVYYQNNNKTMLVTYYSDNSVVLDTYGNTGFIKANNFEDSKFKDSCPTKLWACYPAAQAGNSARAVVDTIYQTSFAACSNRYFELTNKQTDLSPDVQYDENGNLPGESIDNIGLPTGDPMTCESLKNTETYKIVRNVFTWIQIAAPIMLVIFGVVDFTKAVAASDNDAIKKAQGAFVKRVIIAAIIILLPFIVDLLLSLLDGALGNNVSTCDIGK